MTEQLEKLLDDNTADLIAQNVDNIRAALLESEDGKQTVSINCKLTLVGTKLYAKSSLSYSRKWTDEVEGSADVDDNQLKLEVPA